jgi:hypothetical protein
MAFGSARSHASSRGVTHRATSPIIACFVFVGLLDMACSRQVPLRDTHARAGSKSGSCAAVNCAVGSSSPVTGDVRSSNAPTAEPSSRTRVSPPPRTLSLAGSDGIEWHATSSSEPSLPQVDVTTEPISFEGMRERPTGTVAASVADEELQTRNVGGRSDPDYLSSRRNYHPGTRVRVDTTLRLSTRSLRSKSGVALARRVLANLRNQGYWPFRNCFEDAARERPGPGGRARLRLTLGSDGAVLFARVLETQLKNRTVALCFAEAALRLRVEPTRLRRLEVDVVVGVWPGDVALLPLPRPPTDATIVDVREMTRIVETIEADVARCMQVARHNDAVLWGRLCLSYALDETGHPSDVREAESQFGDRNAVACIVERFEKLDFPAPKRGGVRLTAAWFLRRPPPAEPPVMQQDPIATPAIDAPGRASNPEPLL